jgi:two-component system sensor histidine kinase PrrB
VHTLRGRLTLGVMTALAAVLLVAGLVASRQVQKSEHEAFDDRLERTAELSRATALAAVQDEVPEDDRRLDAVLEATGTSLRLVVGKSALLETGAKPAPGRPARLPAGLTRFTAHGEPYRSYVTTLRDPALGGLARLEVVSSMKGLEDRQAALDRRLLALGGVALLFAGLGTWLAAARVLRPLNRLRTVTSSIAGDEDLERRVPADDGPGEVRSLAASFNAMLARLGRSAADRERALAATRRFAADAGHELRTPLTSVQATLSSLSRHPDIPAAQRSAMVADALAEQQRFVALLDGLQAMARGDAVAVEHAPVDLADLLDAVTTNARARHPEATVDARLPDDPVLVTGWEPGLRLLAENLVENAIGHGRHVVVALEEPATLTVCDDGPGVSEEDRERIFEPFFRAPGTERAGSGLGLALVAQQVRHHGARIEVGDQPGGGACFTVRFG